MVVLGRLGKMSVSHLLFFPHSKTLTGMEDIGFMSALLAVVHIDMHIIKILSPAKPKTERRQGTPHMSELAPGSSVHRHRYIYSTRSRYITLWNAKMPCGQRSLSGAIDGHWVGNAVTACMRARVWLLALYLPPPPSSTALFAVPQLSSCLSLPPHSLKFSTTCVERGTLPAR